MGEFNLKLRQKEAIAENTRTLIEEYNKNECSFEHLEELLEIAEAEEEYEVAVSIRDAMKVIEESK